MNYCHTIGLRSQLARHWIHRQWVACRYAFRLHRELGSVRAELVGKFGEKWVAAELPKMTHSHLAASSGKLFGLAANPKIDRMYRQRTARWKVCLQKLSALQAVDYALTEAAGLRIYYAALRCCLSELAGQPVAVPAVIGPLRGSLTSAIIRWLESAGVGLTPVVLATPLGSSAVDPLAAIAADPIAGGTIPHPHHNLWPEAVRQQYACIHEAGLQELHAAYLRCRLAHLAIAQALVVTSRSVDASCL